MFSWLINHLAIPDTREPYYLDADGRALAFVAAGEAGNTPDHEDFTHGMDGTDEAVGHQDPVVITRTEIRCSWRTFFIPVPVPMQYRYYPYTVKHDGSLPDLEQVEARITAQERQLRRRQQQAYQAPMPRWMERRAWNRETAKQRGRGVPHLRLRSQKDSRLEVTDNPARTGQTRHLPHRSEAVRASTSQHQRKAPQQAAKRPARAKRATRADRVSAHTSKQTLTHK